MIGSKALQATQDVLVRIRGAMHTQTPRINQSAILYWPMIYLFKIAVITILVGANLGPFGPIQRFGGNLALPPTMLKFLAPKPISAGVSH